MTDEEWFKLCSQVADAMLEHTRKFTTAIRTSNDQGVRLVGSGSYVMIQNQRILLTCEHVEREGPMEYGFYGTDDVYLHRARVEKNASLDIALADISDAAWAASPHKAEAIPIEHFATEHRVTERAELLFFRGFAGENAIYGFNIHEAKATGYCSQQKQDSIRDDPQIFEIFWEPPHTKFSDGTPDNNRKAMKLVNPQGFSGSLVWNTRYLEVQRAGGTWSPEDAVVTGMLFRWDDKSKTLIARRIEFIREWLDSNI